MGRIVGIPSRQPQIMHANAGPPGSAAVLIPRLVYTAPPTGGSFSITITEQNSGTPHVLVIPYNADAATIQALLDALFGPGVATATAAPPVGAIAVTSLNAGGAGYAPGDLVWIWTGDHNAHVAIDTVGGGGAVLTYHLVSGDGTGYAVAIGDPTQTDTGVGVGFTINILAVDTYPASAAAVTISILPGHGLLPINPTENPGALTGGIAVDASWATGPTNGQELPAASGLGAQVIYTTDGTPAGATTQLWERISLSPNPDDAWKAISLNG